jgi:DNA-binding response OmpR family regulator
MIRGEFRSYGAEVVTVPTDRRWIRFGPYCADLRACELTKHGTRLKLQARPFEILTMLLERPGEVVTREEIRARLWPDGTFVDFDNNISSGVRKLRDSLCDSAAQAHS